MTLERALSFMIEAHSGQSRDGTSPLPYATHPVEVVANLRYIGRITDEDVLCAGFLHDVLEETDVTVDQVKSKFGGRVASLVLEVTRHEPTTAETAGMSESEVYELRSGLLLAEIAAMSPEAQAIKLADRLSNLIGARATRSPEKLARYVEQTSKMLRIIPKSVNPHLWRHVRKAAGLKKKQVAS